MDSLRYLAAFALLMFIAAPDIAGYSLPLTMDAEHMQSDAMRSEVNDFFDVEFANMRQMIIKNELDPLSLPCDEDTFDITLFNRTVNGSVWMGDGKLRGLSTLHRTGNMSIDYGLLQNELIWAGVVGMTGLEVQYAGNSHVGFMSSKFDVEYEIPFLNLDFKTDVFISQAEVTLEYCFIQDLSYTHMSLGGFGPADTPLYKLVVNMLLQVMNDKVQEKVETTVCTLLERALQGGADGGLVMLNM